MNAGELLQKVIAYGADENGIRDRFGGNAELYLMCFQEFLEEPNFAALDEAVARKDYKRAFDAAHALKGLSGNLGNTAFYGAICTLVESLRSQSYESIEAEYANVKRQHENLAGILYGNPPEAEGNKEERHDKAGAKPEEKPMGKRKKLITDDKAYVTRLVVSIVAALVLVTLLFIAINANYSNNVIKASGQHLVEMSNQISQYIEEQIATDWLVAENIADNLEGEPYQGGDAAVLRMLQQKQNTWNISGLMLYTENGFCTHANGSTEANDVASEVIVRAREQGKHMSVMDSKLIYTVPVETTQSYNGSRIAAVSVVQDMKTFLDDMNIHSYDSQAWMYLTEESGVVISMLSNDLAAPTFNFKILVRDVEVTPLYGKHTEEEMFSAPESASFITDNGQTKNYLVSTPVETGTEPLRLFYLAPEAVVNQTMSGFSQRLTALSLLVLIAFGGLALATFLIAYRSRKKLLDDELVARERMFDMLVENTRTAFSLFCIGKDKPEYVSSNTIDVVGDTYWLLEKDENGYRVRNSSNTDSEVMRQANEMISGWDGKSPFVSEYILNDRAVPPYYFEYQLYPVDSEYTDYVGIAQDVTQAHRREEVTRNAMEMATRANDAKSRFLSNMSHDIRTPMNAIMNMADFAMESIDQPKKLGPYLRTIRESSEHLLHLINEVLDMSRVESGQMVINSEPFDIREQIQTQVDMVRQLCAVKEQTLLTDFAGLQGGMVRGDALKLSQIIMNLLSNAVKFTQKKGAIRFTASEIPSLSSDIVDVRFVVEDNGMGISQQDLQHIFDPFYRAGDKRIARIEGTGLGLPICKSYVEAMGGTIHCQSEEGEGSIFTAELFFQKAAAKPSEDEEKSAMGSAPFLGMHCLVAEDNRINQQIAKTLLERVGFIVDFAENGSECVEAFMGAKPGVYDVVYMDIQMPVMDGYQATINIRTSNHPQAKTVPILAMSANVFAEDIEKARMVGMDAYIAKPIMSFDLVEQTNRAINIKKGR